ncbi:MAG: hypothetical protein HY064_12125 [Bacteroidetes bacterium]|nr:hypothetical protein [Bacteroidota bacterium]
MSTDFSEDRTLYLAWQLVKKLELDLRGMHVLTECASGAYAYTALMACMAGAQVTAVGRDSSFGTFVENKNTLERLVKKADLPGNVSICRKEEIQSWNEFDIVTNSGFVRPIDSAIINKLKKDAVICLMWETWELRKNEIDIPAAQKACIPVIGTNENYPLTDMFRYPGLLSLHLLFRMQIETGNSDLVLVGGGLTGKLIAEMWERIGLKFDWFTKNGNERKTNCFPYSDLKTILQKENIDAVICAEHRENILLAGANADLKFTDLKNKFPHLRWGHISGTIDEEELKRSGLFHHPEKIMPFGYMTYSGDSLGPAAVLELNVTGLKVGEVYTRAKRAGDGMENAIAATVKHGAGQDFEGGFMKFNSVK